MVHDHSIEILPFSVSTIPMKPILHTTGCIGEEVPVWDWKHYYDVNVDEQLFEEYRRFSRKKHKDLAPYGEYVKSRGLRWPVVEQPEIGRAHV